ncbi:MAG: KAP family NTPase [Bifidobacteriaceae bacterium]|jgi:hypothetical protein|nr:KAP family NTPase [Bifidobacteriaceae bacterium]
MSKGYDHEYRREFYRNVDQRQALDARQSFYVELEEDAVRGSDLCAKLLSTIEFSTGDAVTLVSGPRGSGKSSELIRLGQELDKVDRPFYYTDIDDFLQPSAELTTSTFMVAVVVGLLEATGEELPEQSKKDIAGKFKKFNINLEEINPSLKFGPGTLSARLGIDLGSKGTAVRKEIDALIAGNPGQFYTALREIVRQIVDGVTTGGEPPVFAIDSIDHWTGDHDTYDQIRTAVEHVFCTDGERLPLPGLHMIYTVPTYVSPGWTIPEAMLNVMVVQEDGGTPFAPGVDALTQVLTRRAPEGDLESLFADPAGIATVVRDSGGLFRILFQLIQQIILLAPDGHPATEATIKKAEATVRQSLANGFTKEHFDILRAVRDRPEGYEPEDKGWYYFNFLEARGAILRYPDGDQPWHCVHPLLWPIL